MTRKTAAPSSPRKPRLLWANPYCLLDTSSGASMSVREMLRQLVAQGYEIRILGCTIFDSPKGAGRLQQLWQGMATHAGQFFDAEDGTLTHQILVTANTFRDELTSREENAWLAQYMYMLDSFKPDAVWFYGGYTLDLLIANEARARGIPSAFYLVNGNYQSTQRWCRDVDLILTDSQNTADLYRQKMGFIATPIGKFIDPARFVAERHERRHLLFVNPSWEKGAAIVVQLALMLEQQRPDITLEVVEARADWSALLQEVTGRLGAPRTALDNVVVTGNTSDMRPVYQRARVLLTPSLWWESGARVLAEAMLNGIPAIVSNHGGSPGLIDDGGIVLDFPAACHEAPYQYIPTPTELQALFDAVVAFYDDQALYDDYVARAQRVGREKHHISVSTRRLTQALAPLVNQKAGNKDFLFLQRKQHKHRLAGIAARPEHLHQAQSVVPRAPQPTVPGEMNLTLNAGEPLPLTPGSDSHPAQGLTLSDTPAAAPAAPFDWDLAGQIVVLDNRASLLRQGAALKLLETGAFAMLAFDPASEVQNPAQHADNPNLQIFPHALLGDGQPATLHACLDVAMSSTLAPLPAERLPEALRQGVTVLTRLPIDTIALDSIEGLPSLDWLVLDALSDTLGILEHGQRALQQALLIQARVSFQATHEGQCTLQQLRDWAERQGFHFLRLNAPQYRSLFPAASGFSSQLESAEVLLIPGEERLATSPAASRKKLAFLLHAVFDARDAACRILDSFDKGLCQAYFQEVSPRSGLEVNLQQEPARKKIQKKHERYNLHIMISEKFSAPFIDFVKREIPESNDKYCITGPEIYIHDLHPKHGVEFLNSQEDFARLELYMEESRIIVFHGLWSEAAYSILVKKPHLYEKTYWLMWGGDFYFPERHSKIKHEVIKNIKNLATIVEKDVEYVRNKYRSKGKHVFFTYPVGLGIDLSGFKKEKPRDYIGVLLGNSAYETNNHLEAIRRISGILPGSGDIKIYCPLSYGPRDYAKRVEEEGRRILGDSFNPIFDFMQPEDYYRFISEEIDIAIFNHTRQQALGNSIALAMLEKTIYMSTQSPVYKMLKDIGLTIGDARKLSVTKFDRSLLVKNKEIVERIHSNSSVSGKLREWMI